MKPKVKGTPTPGPWQYDGHGINSRAATNKGERIMKTCLDYSTGSPDRDRAIADSYLVAAAPELLESAEQALNAMLNFGVFYEASGNAPITTRVRGEKEYNLAMDALRVTIAKARGEE